MQDSQIIALVLEPMKYCAALLFLTIWLVSCRPEVYTPKPRGYYHIPLPKERKYQVFDSTGFPYSFEHPVYSNIITDPKFFGDRPENPYWLNVDFPSIGGKIYISYKIMEGPQSLMKLNEDFYQMTYTVHDKKADYIQDFYFNDANRKVYTAVFNVAGDAASAYQFYATDSMKHYIRGALYFEAAPNADSLQPLNDYLKADIIHLLETIEWK